MNSHRVCKCGGDRDSRAARCQRCRVHGYRLTPVAEMMAKYGVSRRVINASGGYEKLASLSEDARMVMLGLSATRIERAEKGL